jgi:hypothetical protein
MPDYSPGDFHIDAFITRILVGYVPTGMIADQVFPVVTVGKQSNVFPKINRGAWFRRPTTDRAPGTGARNVSYSVSSDTYFAPNYELGTVVPWETIDNSDPPFAPVQRGGEFLRSQLLLDFEVRVRDLIAGGVGSTSTLTGANAWDQFASSDPLTDIEAGQEAIRETTGHRPNVAWMGPKSWIKMKRHPDIVRAIYPGAGVGGTAAPAQFANLIGVSKFLLPEAIRNTDPETVGDPDGGTFVDVWSSDFGMAYIPPAPGIMVPTFGYAFRWTGPNIGAGGPPNFAIERKSNGDIKSEVLRSGYYQDEKIVAAELGFNIQTGITS